MPVTEYLSRFGILPGNSAVANGTAFRNAIPVVQADGLSLVAEEGDYNIDAQGPLELAYFRSCLIAAGPRVQFIHKGTGRFFSFNGSAYNPTGGVNKCVFGGAYPIMLAGNPGQTTEAMYLSGFHNSELKIRARDCATPLLMDKNGAIGPDGQPSNISAVLSRFEVIVSPTADQAYFTQQPDHGVVMVGAYASDFYLNIEGCGAHGSPAVHCDYSGGNRISGSVESNGCGGFWIHQRCTGMEFDRMHCEANGNDGDYIVNSSFNMFRRCNAASPVRSQIYGSYNDFQSGSLSGMQIMAGATKNRFAMNKNLATNGGVSDAGTGTVLYNNDGIANKN